MTSPSAHSKNGSPEYMKWLADRVASFNKRMGVSTSTEAETEQESESQEAHVTFVPKQRTPSTPEE